MFFKPCISDLKCKFIKVFTNFKLFFNLFKKYSFFRSKRLLLYVISIMKLTIKN